jgi:hypothetical protein
LQQPLRLQQAPQLQQALPRSALRPQLHHFRTQSRE